MCSVEVKAILFKAYCSFMHFIIGNYGNYGVTTAHHITTYCSDILNEMFKFQRNSSISQKCVEMNIACFKVLCRKSVFKFWSRYYMWCINKSTYYEM